jgi:hypothetical protein
MSISRHWSRQILGYLFAGKTYTPRQVSQRERVSKEKGFPKKKGFHRKFFRWKKFFPPETSLVTWPCSVPRKAVAPLEAVAPSPYEAPTSAPPPPLCHGLLQVLAVLTITLGAGVTTLGCFEGSQVGRTRKKKSKKREGKKGSRAVGRALSD